MFAAAKADFQPHCVGAMWEQACEIGSNGRRQVERQLRQQAFECGRLLGLERVSLAPSEEGARRPRLNAGQRRARLSASAISVRSQENPPSLSGARPKWP